LSIIIEHVVVFVHAGKWHKNNDNGNKQLCRRAPKASEVEVPKPRMGTQCTYRIQFHKVLFWPVELSYNGPYVPWILVGQRRKEKTS